MKCLVRKGIDCHLHIVGDLPPDEVVMDSSVTYYGKLNKGLSEQNAKLEGLFQKPHFLLFPSRAEAYGFVFCEANAYGMPALSLRTGGIPTVIKDGVNGKLFALNVAPPEIADYLQSFFSINDSY